MESSGRWAEKGVKRTRVKAIVLKSKTLRLRWSGANTIEWWQESRHLFYFDAQDPEREMAELE